MKIICIGRNYVDHAKELDNPVPDQPIFFLKPQTAILPKRNPLYYPGFTKNLHYEVELVVKINKIGKSIDRKFASNYYSEVGVGIDFTARDLQEECKKKGLPWESAKAFDNSAPLSHQFIPLKELGGDINNITFRMEKDGEIVQKGNSGDMIFSVNEIIEHVSKFMTLKIGDLIFTGTPSGVGPTKIGDCFKCFIGDREMLKVNIK